MLLDRPFTVPSTLGRRLSAIQGYWNLLKRGNAIMPFTDDFRSGALGKLADDTVLIESFVHPRRFCFTAAGRNVTRCYGGDLEGLFTDELSSRAPLHLLDSQCRATVDGASPSYYRYPAEADRYPYERLMLPMWGNGRVDAILAAFDHEAAKD